MARVIEILIVPSQVVLGLVLSRITVNQQTWPRIDAD